jgi:hypothetical protein
MTSGKAIETIIENKTPSKENGPGWRALTCINATGVMKQLNHPTVRSDTLIYETLKEGPCFAATYYFSSIMSFYSADHTRARGNISIS